MDENQVARAIAGGELVSPQRIENSWLFALRITGTGGAYRAGIKEFVWRDPALYLNEHFVSRCNGLPVVWVHPPRQVLDGKEFADRIVGTIIYPYIGAEGVEDADADEVWGIARILDPGAANLMREERLSTSPGVLFRSPADNERIETENDHHFLIEGDPKLLDHLAVVEAGVWDKNNGPTGIKSAYLEPRSDGAKQMADETDAERKAREEKEKQDRADAKARDDARARDDAAASEKLDKILSGIDSVNHRLDAHETRLDAMDTARRDAETDPEEEKRQAAELRKLAAEEETEAERQGRRDANGKPPWLKRDDETVEHHSERCDTAAKSHRLVRMARRDGETADAHSKRIDDACGTEEMATGDTRRDEDEGDVSPEVLARTGNERDDTYSRRMDAVGKKLGMKALMRDDGETTAAYCDRLDRMRDDAQRRADARARDDALLDAKKRADAAAADAARARDDAARTGRDLEALRRDMQPRSGDDALALSDAQMRADDAYMAHGDQAPAPMAGETPSAYVRRLLRAHQPHSAAWKGVDLSKLPDEVVVGAVAAQVYADSQAAARLPAAFEPGRLIARHRPRPGAPGMTITEYVGDPLAWMGQFMPTGQRVTHIRTRKE